TGLPGAHPRVSKVHQRTRAATCPIPARLVRCRSPRRRVEGDAVAQIGGPCISRVRGHANPPPGSIRALAAAAGLSPSRVHQLVAEPALAAVTGARGERRAAGGPPPKPRPAAGFSAVAGRRRRPDHRLLLPVLLLQVDGAAFDRLAPPGFPPVR